MIELTPADIGEFRSLWKKETGEEISDEEAKEYGTEMLELVRLVVEPLDHSSPPAHAS